MKIPKAERTTSGNWYIRLRLGGESVSVIEPTKAACVQRAQLIKAEYKAGKREKQAQAPTLGEAIDAFIDARRNVLSPSTIRTYVGIRKTRLQETMARRLDEISDWQKIMDAQAAKYSAKTVKSTWGFVSTILRENGQPVPKIKLPQVITKLRPYLEPEQVMLFMDAVKGQRCEKVALLALHSLRESEIYAVDSSKIDLKRMTIRVQGAVVPDEHNKFVHKETNKNTSSQRVVPIMIPRLAELARDDTPLPSVSAAFKGVNRVCRAAGLPEVGIHGLRYSFASLAYDLGWSERQIMEVGGWSDYQTMHKIYIRLSRRKKDAGTEKMKDFFKNAK